MITKLNPTEYQAILDVVNDAAQAYKGVIPPDQWREPYMTTEEIKEELKNGVNFYGWKENNVLTAVMGIQPINNVTLILNGKKIISYHRLKLLIVRRRFLKIIQCMVTVNDKAKSLF